MWKTFSRSQLAALAATVVDFGTLTIWVELLGQYYAYGVAIGASFGAVANFTINRHWSFEAHEQPIAGQALRYALVSAGSLVLNTVGVYFVTEHLGFHYLYSKLAIAFLIGIFYNYPMHRYFVYEPNRQSEPTQEPETFAQDPDPRTQEPRLSRT